LLGGLLCEEEGIGVGQLDARDLDHCTALLIVPASPDLECLAAAAPRLLVGRFVDSLDVARQVEGRAQVLMLQLEPCLGLGQLLLILLNFSSHPRPLGPESVWRHVVALLGM
jgi:hypothetical protein